MRRSFCEIRRVLKADAAATVVFQNTNPSVWETVLEATVDAGFALERVDVLHKAQPSFKGVKAEQEGERVAASDVVLTLRRTHPSSTLVQTSALVQPIWDAMTAELRRQDLSRRQRTSGHLFAVAVAAATLAGIPANRFTFDDVEAWLRQNCEPTESGWRLLEAASVV
jgi:adenine-specific DNA methylase